MKKYQDYLVHLMEELSKLSTVNLQLIQISSQRQKDQLQQMIGNQVLLSLMQLNVQKMENIVKHHMIQHQKQI